LSFANSSLSPAISPYQSRQQYTPPITIHCISPFANTFFNKQSIFIKLFKNLFSSILFISNTSSTLSIKNRHFSTAHVYQNIQVHPFYRLNPSKQNTRQKGFFIRIVYFKHTTNTIDLITYQQYSHQEFVFLKTFNFSIFIVSIHQKTNTRQKKLSIKPDYFKYIAIAIDQK